MVKKNGLGSCTPSLMIGTIMLLLNSPEPKRRVPLLLA